MKLDYSRLFLLVILMFFLTKKSTSDPMRYLSVSLLSELEFAEAELNVEAAVEPALCSLLILILWFPFIALFFSTRENGR